MRVEVRAVPADSAVATGLLGRYVGELGRRFPDGFDPARTVSAEPTELSPPRGAFLVVWVDEEPRGCGAVGSLSQGIAEIKRMWIDPAVRGAGLGRRLLTALEGAARRRGHHEARLDTSAHLPEAIGLYRSAGYEEISAYNDNRYAAHWFVQALEPSSQGRSACT
ncbi:MAG: GNAT family N-acetyltransferase [Streptosporangiaceae bacterium]